jgi:hypothetical protein
MNSRGAMKKQRLPRGWTEKSIRELAAHYDNQTEEEQAAEIEAALAKEEHEQPPTRTPTRGRRRDHKQ